jgi:hypothetical protein
MCARNKSLHTVAIDVGGSGPEAAILDPKGKPPTARLRVDTPGPATPRATPWRQ